MSDTKSEVQATPTPAPVAAAPTTAVEEVVSNSTPLFDFSQVDAVAAQFQSKFDEEKDPEPVAPVPVPEQPAAEPPVEAAPADKAPEARGLEKLVAREVELRTLENSLKAREEALAAKEQHYAQLEQKASAMPTDFIAELGINPTETLKAAGYDPDHVVRLILAQNFKASGKEVPEQLQRQLDAAEYRNEMRKMQSQLQQFQQQQAAQQFIAQVQTGAQQYVTRGEFKDAPIVAEVAKANAGAVYNEIMDEISRDAAARVGKDTKATVLPYEEAAKRVNERWAAMRNLLGVNSNPTPTASTPAATTNSTKAAQSPSVPTPAKPPAVPLTQSKSLSDAELIDMGVKAGMTEFKRLAQTTR